MTNPLPGWGQMAPEDRTAALLYALRVGWHGAPYATRNHPVIYRHDRALTGLSLVSACVHALTVCPRDLLPRELHPQTERKTLVQ